MIWLPVGVVSQNLCRYQIVNIRPISTGILETYIFFVDDDTLTISHINVIGASNPPLPKDAINPGKTNLLTTGRVHVNLDSLGIAKTTLVVTALSLFDSHLLCISELLTLELKLLNLAVHPLICSVLELQDGVLKTVLIVTVKNGKHNQLVCFEILGSGSVVIEVNKQDFLGLFELLEALGINIKNATCNLKRPLGIGNKVTDPTQTLVLGLFCAVDEVNGRERLDAHLRAKLMVRLAVDLADVELALHFLGQLLPFCGGQRSADALQVILGCRILGLGFLKHLAGAGNFPIGAKRVLVLILSGLFNCLSFIRLVLVFGHFGNIIERFALSFTRWLRGNLLSNGIEGLLSFSRRLCWRLCLLFLSSRLCRLLVGLWGRVDFVARVG
ncbi:hypothetical protein HG531_006287 [Fusarium graminearum]|nr:hypothetical protein HG531_006287 [Fusarium graminearum]